MCFFSQILQIVSISCVTFTAKMLHNYSTENIFININILQKTPLYLYHVTDAFNVQFLFYSSICTPIIMTIIIF